MSRSAQPHNRGKPLPVAATGRALLAAGLGVAVVLNAMGRLENPGVKAERLMRRGDFAAAERQAKAAISATPLDARALKVLAWLTETKPNGEPEAARLMSLANRLGRRDADVQSRLLSQDLAARKYEAAIGHADAMMRTGDGEPETVFAQLVRAADDEAGQLALSRHLVAKPPWRAPFLKFVGSTADPATSEKLLLTLAQRRSAPTPEELEPFIQRLIASSGHANAQAAWRRIAGLPNDQVSVFDGGFEGGAAPIPFDWYFNNTKAGGAAEEDDPAGGGGKSLHVSFDGFSPGTFASQVLALPAGEYRLKMRVLNGSPGAVERLRWRVACLGGEVLTTLLPSAKDGWTAVEQGFRVDGEGCQSAMISVEGVPGGRRRPTDAWFDDVQLTRSAP